MHNQQKTNPQFKEIIVFMLNKKAKLFLMHETK